MAKIGLEWGKIEMVATLFIVFSWVFFVFSPSFFMATFSCSCVSFCAQLQCGETKCRHSLDVYALTCYALISEGEQVANSHKGPVKNAGDSQGETGMEYKLRNVTNGVVIEHGILGEHEAREIAIRMLREYPHLKAISISKHSGSLVWLKGIQTATAYIEFSYNTGA